MSKESRENNLEITDNKTGATKINNTSSKSIQWLDKHDSNSLNIWREAMAQLRHINNDIWNSVRFFLIVNGVVIAALFSVFKLDWTSEQSIIIALIAGIGGGLTLIAIIILYKHRRHYVEMLFLKTLIEDKLDFYKKFHFPELEANLSFPWKVPFKYLNYLKKFPEIWKSKHKFRRVSVSQFLLIMYWLIFILYAVIIISIILGLIPIYEHLVAVFSIAIGMSLGFMIVYCVNSLHLTNKQKKLEKSKKDQ
ncbi:MAG: hypothetical protein ACFE9L_12495 [Candidatus Hodarchaeota archaeon]